MPIIKRPDEKSIFESPHLTRLIADSVAEGNVKVVGADIFHGGDAELVGIWFSMSGNVYRAIVDEARNKERESK